jgi:hypothetical protein
MHAPNTAAAPITRYEQSHERSHKQLAIAALLLGAAALIFALSVLLYVFWLLLAPLTATPFDADGVRCYHRAVQVACLKTAEPPR